MTLPPSKSGDTDRDLSSSLAVVARFQAALQKEDRAATVSCLHQLMAVQPALGVQWQAVARIAADNGEIRLARRAMDIYVASFGASPAAQYNWAGLLAYVGAWKEALELLRTLPTDILNRFACAHSRARCRASRR